jgi:hypothetical protein
MNSEMSSTRWPRLFSSVVQTVSENCQFYFSFSALCLSVSQVRTSDCMAQPAEADIGSQTLLALLLATVCSMKRTPSRPSYTFG